MDSRLRRLLIKERIELLERCPNKIPVSSLRRPYNKDFYRASRMFNWEMAFTEIRPGQGTTPLSRKIPDGIIWCLNKYVAAVTECRLAGTLSWDEIGKIEALSLEELVRILSPIEVGEDDITVADLEEYNHRNRASRRSQRSRTTVLGPVPNHASIEPPKMRDVARRKWRDSLTSVDTVTNDTSKTDNAAPKRVPARVRPTWGGLLPASNETDASKLGAPLSVTLLSARDAPAPKNNSVRTDGDGRTRVRPTWGSSAIVSNDLHDAKFALPHSGHCVPDKDAAKAKCNIVGTADRARVRVRPTWDCPALPIPTSTLNDVAKLDVPPCGPRIPDTDAAKAMNRQMIADGRRVRPTWGSAAVLSTIATNDVPSTLNSTSIPVNKDAKCNIVGTVDRVRVRVRPTWDCPALPIPTATLNDVAKLDVPPCGPRIPDTDAAKAMNRQMIADGRRVRPTWGSAAVLSTIATNDVPSTLNSTSIPVNKDAPKLFNVRTRVRPTWDCATVSTSIKTSGHVSNLKVPTVVTEACSGTGASSACPTTGTSSLVGGLATSSTADVSLPTNMLPMRQTVARQPSRCAATLLCTTPRSRRVENSRTTSPTATVTNSEESTATTQNPPPKPKRGQWRNDVMMGDEQPTEVDVVSAERDQQSSSSATAAITPVASTEPKGTRSRAKTKSRTTSPALEANPVPSPRKLRPRKPVNYADQEESTRNVRRGRKPPASAPKKREKKPAIRSREDTKQGSTLTEKEADSKDENEQNEPQASGSRNVVPSVQVPPRDRDLFSSDDDLDDEPLPASTTFVLKVVVVNVVTGQEMDAETDSAYGSRPVSREDHIPGIHDVPDTFSSPPQTRASRRSEWTGSGSGGSERSSSSPKVSLGASPVASGSRSTASSVASGSSSPTQVTPSIGTAVPSTSPVLQDSMMTPKMKKKEKRRRSLSRSLSRSVARVSRFLGLTTKK